MSVVDIEKCKELRKRIFITGYKGGMAHLASCFSALEIIYVLYEKNILRFDAKDPHMRDRDRFILSKGHAGLALYAVMQDVGFLSKDDFESYLQPGGRIGGEPCMRDVPGIEATTGSLGHGLSMGLGMALGQKIRNINAKTYVMLGDGECQEGTVWEAIMSAPALGLNNLVVILDSNKIQKMDTVENIMRFSDLGDKVSTFGWEVKYVDGHDIEALTNCLGDEKEYNKPLFIIANTTKGKGVSIMENNPIWHFKLPNKKEKKIFMEELNITESEME